jgi:hypothetical protein
MNPDLSKHQLQILQHSLGCDEFGRSRTDRNHFMTHVDSKDGPTCLELVSLGLMSNTKPVEWCGGMNLFCVTAEGKEQMRLQSPEPPPQEKLTRSKQRYLDYIRADSGLSFREWLGIKNVRRRKVL